MILKCGFTIHDTNKMQVLNIEDFLKYSSLNLCIYILWNLISEKQTRLFVLSEYKNKIKQVNVMSHNFFDYDSSGPRPPIPGEETTTNQKVCLISKKFVF